MAATYRNRPGPGSRTPDRDSDRTAPCDDCRTGELDDLECHAAGIAEQARLTEEAAAPLAERRKEYDAVRPGYIKARREAAPEVKSLRARAEKLVDQIKCLLDDAEVVELLDTAWQKVLDELSACGGTVSCSGHPACGFDDVGPDTEHDRLLLLKAEAERAAAGSEACFDSLITEPRDLPDRIAEVRTSLTGITEALSDKGRPEDELRHLYVDAVFARHRLQSAQIWRGFDDVDEFIDHLCLALTCSLRARRALAVIGGALARHGCREEARRKRCAGLHADPVDDVLIEYAKLARRSRQSHREAD